MNKKCYRTGYSFYRDPVKKAACQPNENQPVTDSRRS